MSANQQRFPFAHILSRFLHTILGGAIIIAAAGTAAKGQQIGGLREGARVKIDAAGAKELVGVIRSAGPDSTSLFVDGSGGMLTISNSSIRSVKMSRGRTTGEGAIKGSIWGGIVGAAIGALIVATPEADTYYDQSRHKSSEFVTMVLGGALWGMGIGAFTKAEKWDKVSMQPRITASRNAVGLAFALNRVASR